MKGGGVNEWARKRRAIEMLCGDGTRDETITKVWGENGWPRNLYDSYGKFGHSPPTMPIQKEFFDRLAVFFACRDNIKGADLIKSSYDEFVRHMSTRRRVELRRLEGTTEHVHFLVDLDANRGDMRKDWLRNETVDQRYMYQDREAVDGWNGIVRSGSYHMYENCKRVLDDFLLGKVWQELISSGQLGSVVILGAGAAAKDTEILNSILNSNRYGKENPVKFVVFDSSFYMLSDTITVLDDVLKRRRGAYDTVEIIACCADFLRLRAWRDQIRPEAEGKKTAIFILGGTIGNVDESALLDAVRHVTEVGDIFVVSAELVPENDRAAYIAYLDREYDQPETKDFALSAARTLLDEEGYAREVEKRRDCVGVKIETDTVNLPSRIRSLIPGTVAAVFRLTVPIECVHLTLVASKRYEEKAFIAAVTGFHCDETHCIEKRSKWHKYLVFKRE